MPAKLTTTLSKIPSVPNPANAAVIDEFYRYMKVKGSSESHTNNCLKVVIAYARFLGTHTTFFQLERREQVLAFLDTKMKSIEEDPEQKWITTWNHNLRRLKLFFRWLYNRRGKEEEEDELEYGAGIGAQKTPAFVRIRERRTKRLSPYSETEIWERDEILFIVRYEPQIRNKAALTLFWDLDARNHEVTLLKIKHVRLKERYGEGEIPYEAKTGSGPILLMCSFPYVRDLLNVHPCKNDPEARIICNLYDGTPVGPDAMWGMMKRLRQRIERMMDSGEIRDQEERRKVEYLLKTKRWNPYCIRHSAITYDADYLPEFALKKKVRWSMNSRQPSRYIKRRIGNDLEMLIRSGIVPDEEALRQKPAVLSCPRCSHINASECKLCSKCSYPLTAEGYEEVKADEKVADVDKKIEAAKREMEERFQLLLEKVDLSRLHETAID